MQKYFHIYGHTWPYNPKNRVDNPPPVFVISSIYVTVMPTNKKDSFFGWLFFCKNSKWYNHKVRWYYHCVKRVQIQYFCSVVSCIRTELHIRIVQSTQKMENPTLLQIFLLALQVKMITSISLNFAYFQILKSNCQTPEGQFHSLSFSFLRIKTELITKYGFCNNHEPVFQNYQNMTITSTCLELLEVCKCFEGVEKGCIGNE